MSVRYAVMTGRGEACKDVFFLRASEILILVFRSSQVIIAMSYMQS